MLRSRQYLERVTLGLGVVDRLVNQVRVLLEFRGVEDQLDIRGNCIRSEELHTLGFVVASCGFNVENAEKSPLSATTVVTAFN